MPETESSFPRRWTVIASGLLLFALALVVIYSSSNAFHSPVAVVVLSAIGLVAVLLQVRLRQTSTRTRRIPQLLTVIGILCAGAALFADRLGLASSVAEAIALAAVGCFGISSVIVLDGLRKDRTALK